MKEFMSGQCDCKARMRLTGLEPAHLAIVAPKTTVSAYSTTGANEPLLFNYNHIITQEGCDFEVTRGTFPTRGSTGIHSIFSCDAYRHLPLR